MIIRAVNVMFSDGKGEGIRERNLVKILTVNEYISFHNLMGDEKELSFFMSLIQVFDEFLIQIMKEKMK